MRKKLHWASGLAVACTMLTALLSAQGSGALAEEFIPVEIESTNLADEQAVPAVVEGTAIETQVQPAATLLEMIERQPQLAELSRDMQCLAGAIYFEARGESIKGQLAVGRVVVERAASSRFPDSYCGVIFQRSQFSFVQGNRMPHIKRNSKAWRKAVALAQIADAGSWDSPVEGALFFHAAYVSPNWRLTRLERIDNHIFYR